MGKCTILILGLLAMRCAIPVHHVKPVRPLTIKKEYSGSVANILNKYRQVYLSQDWSVEKIETLSGFMEASRTSTLQMAMGMVEHTNIFYSTVNCMQNNNKTVCITRFKFCNNTTIKSSCYPAQQGVLNPDHVKKYPSIKFLKTLVDSLPE